MSKIEFYNTLKEQKEEFKPINEQLISMYHCGPTVHNYAHIGNLRSYVFADTIRRLFESLGFDVKQVINITDVGHLSSDADSGEDKMTKALVREGKPFTIEAMREVGEHYTKLFFNDLSSLNIRTENTHFPRASDFIEKQIAMVLKLGELEYTYETEDGIYFDTSKFKDYGKLGNINSSKESAQSRIDENREKKNPSDFAVWKKSQNGIGFQSPWGLGYPGWHLECSVMSQSILGETFDIHTGGIDHIAIHHNNEIAQSESVTGKPLANYWMHNEHINVDNKKMAKSGESFIILNDIKDKGYSPIAYRLLLLMAHYRTQMSFSYESLSGAQNALNGIYKSLSSATKVGEISLNHAEQFVSALSDDLDTPKGVSILFEVINSKLSADDKYATALYFDQFLGINIENEINNLKNETPVDIPISVANLVQEREFARNKKDFERADLLRDEISKLGFSIEDKEGGPLVRKLQ
jgi:cysteinyl-tRNA synthetase